MWPFSRKSKASKPAQKSVRPRFGSGFEALESREVPAIIYGNTFEWQSGVDVTVTVRDDMPGYMGQYHWNYHVANDSFASGIGTFALPAEDATMVSNVGNNAGWTGSVGTFMGNADLIAWQAGGGISPPPPPGGPPGPPMPLVPLLGVGQSADFWFTTIPTGMALTNGFVTDSSQTVTANGLLSFPTAAPIPAQPMALTVFSKENNENKLLTLRAAIKQINDGVTDRGQAVTEIRFAEGLTGKTITLLSDLPDITKKMFINGEDRNITVERNSFFGNFRIVKVVGAEQLQTVTISNLTFKGGGGNVGPNPVDSGGAIESSAKLVLNGCTIRDSIANRRGGGVSAVGGTLEMLNCNIFDNSAEQDGGGIYIGDAVTSVTITGGTIHHNHTDQFGGALYISGGLDVPIAVLGVHIYANIAGFDGGGVYVLKTQGGTPHLMLGNGTVITNNFALGEDSLGGGVYLGAGTLTLGYAAITGNGASFGGGLYLRSGTTWNGDPFGYIWNNLVDDVYQEPPP